MLKFNKKIIIIIASAVLVLAIAITTTLILVNINPADNKANVVTKEQTDTIKAQAIEALQNNDTAKAKTLFEQAKRQYDELNTTGVANEDQVDVNAQLGLLNQPTETNTTSN